MSKIDIRFVQEIADFVVENNRYPSQLKEGERSLYSRLSSYRKINKQGKLNQIYLDYIYNHNNEKVKVMLEPVGKGKKRTSQEKEEFWQEVIDYVVKHNELPSQRGTEYERMLRRRIANVKTAKRGTGAVKFDVIFDKMCKNHSHPLVKILLDDNYREKKSLLYLQELIDWIIEHGRYPSSSSKKEAPWFNRFNCLKASCDKEIGTARQIAFFPSMKDVIDNHENPLINNMLEKVDMEEEIKVRFLNLINFIESNNKLPDSKTDKEIYFYMARLLSSISGKKSKYAVREYMLETIENHDNFLIRDLIHGIKYVNAKCRFIKLIDWVLKNNRFPERKYHGEEKSMYYLYKNISFAVKTNSKYKATHNNYDFYINMTSSHENDLIKNMFRIQEDSSDIPKFNLKRVVNLFNWIEEHDRYPIKKEKHYNFHHYLKNYVKKFGHPKVVEHVYFLKSQYDHFLVVNFFENTPSIKRSYEYIKNPDNFKSKNVKRSEDLCKVAFDWIVKHDRLPRLTDKNEKEIYNLLNYIKGRQKRRPDCKGSVACRAIKSGYSHYLVKNIFDSWPKIKKEYKSLGGTCIIPPIDKVANKLEETFRQNVLKRFVSVIEWVGDNGRKPHVDGDSKERRLFYRTLSVKELGLEEECKKLTDNPLVLEMLK